MNNLSKIEELDQAIEVMIAGSNPHFAAQDAEVAELLSVASELRQLPRPDFKTRLKTELDWVVSERPLSPVRSPLAEEIEDILPSLFGKGYGTYPIQRMNFAASAALHAVALSLVLALGVLAFKDKPRTNVAVTTHFVPLSEYIPPAGTDAPHGGGGGGDVDKVNASHGTPPRASTEQLTPPVVVVRNSDPKLAVEPTIIAPNMQVPQSNQMGDPLSTLMNPSSGTGVRGGIGAGDGGGVGADHGPGLGPGNGGNSGEGFYHPGSGITGPHLIYAPDPEYSPEARAAKYQGMVILHAIVAPDGRVHAIQVASSLGMGLDEKAIEAVNTWRFEPGQKDGHPVPVMIEIYVSFHLY